MAKFRTNHRGGKKAKGSTIRFVVFGISLLFAIGLFLLKTTGLLDEVGNISEVKDYTVPISQSESDRYYLPTGGQGEIVHHTHYSLSYREDHEQAEWVAYELTRASLKVKNVPRAKRFNPDYDVKTRSAFHRDYTHSGYTRGHLAPAGDMAFDKKAMQESFYMSNMTPQIRALNNGIWKELEEQTRDWAYSANKVYIVTGPMLNRPYKERIGDNKVSVPSAFYKIILDIEKPEQKAIAFIIPHEKSTRPLQDYAVTIDDIEDELGINFFENLISTELQDKLESNTDLSKWKFSEKRYQLRVNKWNNQ